MGLPLSSDVQQEQIACVCHNEMEEDYQFPALKEKTPCKLIPLKT
jgi:hypothetical protein